MATPASTAYAAVPDGASASPSSPRSSPLSLAAWRRFLDVALPYWKGDQRRAA